VHAGHLRRRLGGEQRIDADGAGESVGWALRRGMSAAAGDLHVRSFGMIGNERLMAAKVHALDTRTALA